MKKFILIIGSVLLLSFSSVYALNTDPAIALPVNTTIMSTNGNGQIIIGSKYRDVVKLAKKIVDNADLIRSCKVGSSNTILLCGKNKISFNQDVQPILMKLKNDHWIELNNNNAAFMEEVGPQASDFTSQSGKRIKLAPQHFRAAKAAFDGAKKLAQTYSPTEINNLTDIVNQIAR